MNVPQEIQKYIDTLNGDDAIEIAVWAFKHAIEVGAMTPEALSGFILAEFSNDEETVSLAQYGVFVSHSHVRVSKVLPEELRANMADAERETYASSFRIGHDPGEYSGRIVEGLNRDMAIYTAGLLDGVDQVEARLELEEDRCASGHTV